MTRDADEQLVARAQRGDMTAFERLVDHYERKIYNLAYRLTGNHEDAGDMAQEAFIRVYQSLPNFRGESAFATWLFKIASNACLDELRRRKRQPVSSLDEPVELDDGETPRQFADVGDGPEQAVERRELQRAVHESIMALPEEYRIVLVLRDLHDLSYNEIVELTGLTLGTVKSRLNRARAQLKEKLLRLELLPPHFVYTDRRGKLSEL